VQNKNQKNMPGVGQDDVSGPKNSMDCLFFNYLYQFRMKKLISFLCVLFLFACNSEEKHFMTDKAYREKVQKQFESRKKLAAYRYNELFSVLERPLSDEQKEALDFLYAYMPLSDLADYDGDFFLHHIDAAFKARDFFSWGKTVPEDIFRHFVLVYRVNNENLDTARMVFFEELKDRIKDMSMAEAALEVNHWCHEKVTYRGTDGRTSAPLALMRTSWGRCGEESTFTAAALRAVGIPARQCYTPRWVHTDDNHAWVEVWIDGKWRYMGACEPEPELDMAWLTGPVTRAMMVHTNVFGLYNGPEEKNLETPLYSKINLLSNYTRTRHLSVKVTDREGKPVENAKIRFKVYNYAELYPIAETVGNSKGCASIITGLGDLIVWANKGEQFGYAKAGADRDSVTVVLDGKKGEEYDVTYELVPPAEQKLQEVSPEKQALNAGRLAEEDAIRNAYMATFITEEKAGKALDEMNISDETARKELSKYLVASQGNRKEIQSFIGKNIASPYLIPFLASLSGKDLRDTPEKYLDDHFNSGQAEAFKLDKVQTREFFAQYILSPRIGRELIRPWRKYFINELGSFGKEDIRATDVLDWIKQNIKLIDGENYYGCPLSPRGVYDLRHADKYSRNVFFVAVCRSAGVPARIEKSTGRPQYFENGAWTDAVFEAVADEKTKKADLTLRNNRKNIITPKYYTNFTVGRVEEGDFVTLDYEDGASLKDHSADLSVDTGYYRMMVGTRANDGSVTVHALHFNIKDKRNRAVKVTLPETSNKMQVMGIVDMNTRIDMADGSHRTLKELSNGKGVMLCFIDPDKEPSKHVLQDLPAVQNALETWGGGIVFLTPDDKLSGNFDPEAFRNLPAQKAWAIDGKRVLLNGISNTLQLDFTNNFPLVLFLNGNGGILFFSEGYRIGIGENILKTIREYERQ
jgi:hypothetical protein